MEMGNRPGQMVYHSHAYKMKGGVAELPDLKTSVLNLLGHGAPMYITSPDISSRNSIVPQGERGILCKVNGVEDFGRVITHSPFAEIDYFRANTAMLKRIRFALRFSSGALVNMHGANWSFSIIFQEAE